jgi:NADH-quinone oxidoreductase subunit N
VGSLILAGGFAVASLPQANVEVFFGSLAIDPFGQMFKILLIGFTALTLLQWSILDRTRSHRLDHPDFLCLLLGTAVGLSLMASANDLLMIVLAIEAASLPSYALAGFRKPKASAAEASLKYVLFGAVCSAVMIYGLSLVYGACGSLGLAEVGRHLHEHGVGPLLGMGLLAAAVGIGFKLSVVPLHFWCPDVFEAAPTSVTTYLAVASKGAGVILLARVVYALSLGGQNEFVMQVVFIVVAVVGCLAATWGNLAAIQQTGMTRLLAYSSIAQTGYMVMAAAGMAMAGLSGTITTQEVGQAILFYVVVYALMKLGAFTAVASLARRVGSDRLSDWSGLHQSHPLSCLLLVVFMLSLTGIPPLGGFLGKLLLLAAMAEPLRWLLIGVLVINTVISFYYYLGRPVSVMYWQSPPSQPAATAQKPELPLALPVARLGLQVACGLLLLLTGLGAGTSLVADYASLGGGLADSVPVESASAGAQTPAGQPQDEAVAVER